ncbi:MAG: transporter substrate-binding domain-containing protein [Deltaproteobacteria bacterium]|nr:transporter substrate-binding domain-containing protein [Deltaproteobacteria bacterium]MBN2670242.1 transporter substrate-binding domain-containing protein [Deltaproteobacteria bacterium]
MLLLCPVLLAAKVPNDAQKTKVTAGVLSNFPPQYTLDDDGTPQGFAVDIMNEIAARARLQVTYVVYDSWPALLSALKAGEIDMIPNQGITPERQELFSYSAPVETFGVSIFTRADRTDIDGLSDCAGKTVGVVKMNVGEQLVKKCPQTIPQLFDHPEDALFSLLSGNVDAVIYPEPVFMRLARTANIDDHIRVVGKPLTEIKRAISVSRNNPELLQQLNPAVAQLIASPTYRRIYNRWYGKPKPFLTSGRVAAFMGAILLGAVLGMGIWRYRSLIRINLQLAEQNKRRQEAEQALRLANDTLEENVKKRTRELETALSDVKTLTGLLPICSFCKGVRNDQGYWDKLEKYICDHTDAEVTHGLCPECFKREYPEEFAHVQSNNR